MLKRHVLVPPAALLFFMSGLPADGDFIDRLVQLRERRDQAVRRAAVEIDATYRRELEKLLAEATRAGDKENAARIRSEIQSLTNPDRDVEARPVKADDGVEAILMSRSWEWHAGSSAGELRNHGTIAFLEDGKIRPGGGLGFLSGWKPLKKGRFEVSQPHGAKWLFEYDPKKGRAETVRGEAGYINDLKWLVPVVDE